MITRSILEEGRLLLFFSVSSPLLLLRVHSLDSEPGIEDFAKTITDEREASYSQHDEDPREDGHPPLTADDILAAFSNHESPFRGRELCTQSNEAQPCHPEDAVTRIDSR